MASQPTNTTQTVLLIDLVRTCSCEVVPTIEHSLGLLYLASAVREAHGRAVSVRVETEVADELVPENHRANLAALVDEVRPDIVGLRCLTNGRDLLRVAAATIREIRPDCVLVAGGPHPSDNPEQVLEDTCVDVVVIGEGERVLTELVQRRRDGESFLDLTGTAARLYGQALRNLPRNPIADLDGLVHPAYDLVDLDRFTSHYRSFSGESSRRHANLITTRGCPYRCMYCHNVLGKGFRPRSPEDVVAEIRWLVDEHGVDTIQVVDDLFNLDGRRARRICDLLVEARLDVALSFPHGLRCDVLDDELLDGLAAANTRFVSFGIESGSPRIQDIIRRNLTLEKAFDAIERTRARGIMTKGFFLVGFPTETEQDVRQTIDFACQSALTIADFSPVAYAPGTELHQLARGFGYFRDDPGEDVRRYYEEIVDGPYEFGPARLYRLLREAVERFAFTSERVDEVLRIAPGFYDAGDITGLYRSYLHSAGPGSRALSAADAARLGLDFPTSDCGCERTLETV